MPKHKSTNQEYDQYVVNKSKTTSINFKGYLNQPRREQLLPLLDRLDEVEPSLHESCVRELNEWLQGTIQPLYLVVCSLWGDIRDSSQQDIWQLSLNGVIQLKPLTQEQIQRYLISLDCTELGQMLEQDTNLLELVRTPLLIQTAPGAIADTIPKIE